ncbi:hypothetical protein QNH23_06400 [Siminovitchia fortis]|uniref:Uncharacterized protein n=1 Tax=Siminovitchia fortis TaxID=254758 RepID=A0A443IM49_9BACI|nr:hypothetical protein [Siminovitchia fortis]RWR06734.1 hypothetical protein D4N35_013800 [Siminovitchia fortis]WHY83002.1 hypothetical protein QNH23_06400 [Siminovitchia fortis]
MADTSGMKIKFVVLKKEDVYRLPAEQQANLGEVWQMIAENRKKEGKRGYPKYLVINTDESYADEVIEILKRNGHWG